MPIVHMREKRLQRWRYVYADSRLIGSEASGEITSPSNALPCAPISSIASPGWPMRHGIGMAFQSN